MRRLLLVLVLALLTPTLAWAKPPVWVLHGKGATITLFGSVHILPHDVDWEPETLKRALPAGVRTLGVRVTDNSGARTTDTLRVVVARR